jgi:hypothetical protein
MNNNYMISDGSLYIFLCFTQDFWATYYYQQRSIES